MAFVRPLQKFAMKGNDNIRYNHVWFYNGYVIAITSASVYFAPIEDTTEFLPEQISELNRWGLTMEAWQLLEKATDVGLEKIDKILHGYVELKTYTAEIEFISIPDEVIAEIQQYMNHVFNCDFHESKMTSVNSLDLKAFLEVSKCTNPYIARVRASSWIWAVMDAQCQHMMVSIKTVDDPLFALDELRVASSQLLS